MNDAPGKPLRAGIVGLGGMGHRHAGCLVGEERVDLAWGCARSPERREAFAAAFGVPTAERVPALLERWPVDLLVVATPTAHHAAYLRLGIDVGASVLVEKPLTDDVAAARGLVAECGTAPVQVGHCMVHDGAVAAARVAIREQSPLRGVEVIRRGPAVQQPGPVGTRQEPAWMYEQLIHLCSIIHTLAGQPLARVQAVQAADFRRHAETFIGEGSFPDGARWRLDVRPDGDEQLLAVRCRGEDWTIEAYPGRAIARMTAPERRMFPVRRGNLFALQARSWIDDVLAGRPPAENLERGLWAMEAATMLVGSR